MGERQIRAVFNDSTIRIYQAYSPRIGVPVLDAGHFVPPFKLSRMTWIKPSFCWMMYRSGYATKPGQEMILAVDITREAFDWCLDQAALSSFPNSGPTSLSQWKCELETAPVVVQWDPERDLRMEKIKGARAIQIGLRGEAAKNYATQWVIRIKDVTSDVHQIRTLLQAGCRHEAEARLPQENLYPVKRETERRLGID